jgi:ABC-type multidrug transport system ATPase subunit
LTIDIQNLGKRFNRHWIFRNFSFRLEAGNAYAIVGPNGSGKSTLMQVIAGVVDKSEGEIHFSKNGNEISKEFHYNHLSIAAPYLELIEELTLEEFLSFHFSFKTIRQNQTIKDIINYIGLADAAQKQVRYFSSGMKQRVKLAQAVFSDTDIVILDEPTANLDVKGIALYKKLIKEFCQERLVIICSNDENEIDFCNYRIDVSNFKPAM